MTPANTPFTDDDRKAIIASIKEIDELQPIIAKAKSCNMPCEEVVAKLDANRKRLSKILTEFWPMEL